MKGRVPASSGNMSRGSRVALVGEGMRARGSAGNLQTCKSRFSEKLHFPDFSVKDACKLLTKQLGDDDLNLNAEANSSLLKLMSQVGWGAKGRAKPSSASEDRQAP